MENDGRAWTIRNTGADGDKFQIRDITANAERLTIDSTGNVGIGSINPGQRLDVNGNITTQRLILKSNNVATTSDISLNGNSMIETGESMLISIDSDNDSTTSYLAFIHDDADGTGWSAAKELLKINESGLIQFFDGTGSETFRVESDGKVGIQDSSPIASLDVFGGYQQLNTNIMHGGLIYSGVWQSISEHGWLALSSGDYRGTEFGNVHGFNFYGGNVDGTTIAYTSKNDGSQYFVVSAGDVNNGYVIPGTTFTIGGNTYTVTTSRIVGTDTWVYVHEDISGEAASGNLSNLRYSNPIVKFTSDGKVGIGTITGLTAKLTLNGDPGMEIRAGSESWWFSTNASDGNLYIADNGANKVVIENGGQVGIGLTNPSQALDVNGYVRATGYYHSSDERLKESIHKSGGIEIISQLQGVGFNWIETGEKDYGVIAQEVEKVLPDLVTTNPETGIKSVKYDGLIAPLIEATKEQQQSILQNERDLKREIKILKENLKSKDETIKSLELRIEKLEVLMRNKTLQ